MLFRDPPEEPVSKRRITLSESRTPEPSELVRVSRESQPSTLLVQSRSSREAKTQGKGQRGKRQKDLFLQGVPVPSKWRNRQIELGLCTVEQYKKVIQIFVGRPRANVKELCERDLCSENELVAIAMKLVDSSFDEGAPSIASTDPLFENKALLKVFSYFQALLLLSFCTVLQTRGIPDETIDRITKQFAAFREKDRRRLRIHAVKINGLINKLVRCGWSIYQATELFFISMFSKLLLFRS